MQFSKYFHIYKRQRFRSEIRLLSSYIPSFESFLSKGYMPETVAILMSHDTKRCNLIWGKLRQALTTFTCCGIIARETTVNKQETRVTLKRRAIECECERFKTPRKRERVFAG